VCGGNHPQAVNLQTTVSATLLLPLTRQELVGMDGLHGPGDVRVHAHHAAHLAHFLFVVEHLVGNGDAKVQDTQVRGTCFLDVAVHVHLVVEHLVVLHDETFKSGVLIALQRLHQVLHGRQLYFLFL
jgi:hypothetical protein